MKIHHLDNVTIIKYCEKGLFKMTIDYLPLDLEEGSEVIIYSSWLRRPVYGTVIKLIKQDHDPYDLHNFNPNIHTRGFTIIEVKEICRILGYRRRRPKITWP